MFPHIFTWQMKSSVLMIQKHHETSLLSRFEDLSSTGHSYVVIFFASASPRFFLRRPLRPASLSWFTMFAQFQLSRQR